MPLRAGVPLTARLAVLLAPDLSLWPAFRASVAFLLLSTAAWSLLTLGSDLRSSNQTTLAFQRWTAQVVSPSSGEDMAVPAHAAGVPLGGTADPSLIISLDSVRVASMPLTTLTNWRPVAGWSAVARSMTKTLEGFRRDGKPPAIRVLAHPDLPMFTLVEVFDHLRLSYQVTRFNLVVDRHPPESKPGVRVQAALRLEVATPSSRRWRSSACPTTSTARP